MSRQTSRLMNFCVCAAIALSGCNSARLVTVEKTGGVVAIPNNTNNWPSYNRQHAEELMQANCSGGGYVIDREEEFVTGTTQFVNTTTNTKGDRVLAALQIAPVTQESQQQTTTQNHTEWRIWFNKVNAQAPSAMEGVRPAAAPLPVGLPRGEPVPITSMP